MANELCNAVWASVAERIMLIDARGTVVYRIGKNCVIARVHICVRTPASQLNNHIHENLVCTHVHVAPWACKSLLTCVHGNNMRFACQRTIYSHM